MEEEDESLEKLLKWAAEMGITDSTIQNPSHTRNCLGHSLTVSHFPEAGEDWLPHAILQKEN